MSDNSLPDEIISEILSPALKVSDEVFSDTSDVSPFAKYSESTSAYLLVCKSWLRVATPLLYNVVILRSKAQAKALSEDGPPMNTILQCSPNVSDLFLSLVIYSSDNTNGLCKGLDLINPTRLILHELERKPLDNKMVSQLLNSLSKSIIKWDRLCVFDCPFPEPTVRAEIVVSPLAKDKRLHTLTLPSIEGLPWAYSTFKGCPLKSIRIKRPVERRHQGLIPEKNPALMPLLKFDRWALPKVQESAVNVPLTPSLNPSFIPMAGAPKAVYDEIWAHVLYFATTVPRRLPLLLVSKTFHRLGLPYYYADVKMSQLAHISKFASILSYNPSIGPHVRSLALKYQDRSDFEKSNVDYSMLTILSQTNKALRITGETSNPFFINTAAASISWDNFVAMAKYSGSTLREFSVKLASTAHASTTVFTDLSALRILEWKCETSFLSTNTPQDGLPNLEDLRIIFANESFLTVLSLMKLKSLRRVTLSDQINLEAFLGAHGPKLTEVNILCPNFKTSNHKIFEVCSNLRCITVKSPLLDHQNKPPEAIYFSPPHAVTSLTKITFDVFYFNKIPKDNMVGWERFFIEFKPASFPNLREMEVKCCVWPTSEREIEKSCWVRWAEILLKSNINLTDKNGVKWRPRLKVK
ncbi:hypothetical protein DFH08DRAFT_998012 [Mycena albidolilacea]|uniref:Uncharacterized protein n=1 Tax=Mycena albidolilacea TaxID=1033008 RepID=A0AAD7A4F4_9AGAR|nr:hypothetical protein DFH08DRAFT_998012 [Mycena albidolilacea]